MNRLRLLMLGWEFPPLINGGLGIACHALARRLADSVDLQVVLPHASEKGEGFKVCGLNTIGLEQLVPSEVSYRYQSFAQVENVPISLDPYSSEQGSVGWLGAHAAASFGITRQDQLARFQTEDLYGSDLGLRVVEYSKVVAKLAMQMEFDIIHAHDWMTYLAGVEVQKATGKPLVVHVHGTHYDRAGANDRGWIHEIECYGMEQAQRVIPVSHYTGKICVSHYGIDPEKIRPVHNGVDPVETFRAIKKSPEKLVLFLGRLTAQKGPGYFLDIASKLLEMNRNVRFVMAGTGEQHQQLIDGCASRGLGDKVQLVGFLSRQQVYEMLSMSDVYCMPSVSEPFGLSALEAAQFGVPTVISRQSGCGEVLKSALIADYWDAELMARHIHDLLTDEKLRNERLRQAAKDMESVTWEAAAKKVMAIYRELI